MCVSLNSELIHPLPPDQRWFTCRPAIVPTIVNNRRSLTSPPPSANLMRFSKLPLTGVPKDAEECVKFETARSALRTFSRRFSVNVCSAQAQRAFPNPMGPASQERAHQITTGISPAMLLTVRWDVCWPNSIIFQSYNRSAFRSAGALERTFVVVV